MHSEGDLSATDDEVALVAVGLVFRPGLAFLHHVCGVHDSQQASVVGDPFPLSMTLLGMALLNVMGEALLGLADAAAVLAGKDFSIFLFGMIRHYRRGNHWFTFDI